MKNYAIPYAALAATLALAACGNNNTPPFTGAFRAVNGISDNTSGINVQLGSVTSFSNLAFDTASGTPDVPEGSYNAHIDVVGLTGFDVDNVNINHNNVSTVFTYGQEADSSDSGFIAEEALNAPTNGQVVIQPLHDALTVSKTAATLYFYFIKPSATPVATGTPAPANFATSADPLPLAGDTYEILVTDGTTTLFDSGPKGIALPLSDGSDVFQLAALDATTSTSDGSTMSLLLLDNNGHYTQLLNGQN